MTVFHSTIMSKTCLLFLFFSAEVFASDVCDFNVKLKQVLLNKGFHRNITYGIVFDMENADQAWMYKDCVVGLDQGLPSGVYANADELEEFRRSRRLKAMTKKRINTELFAEEARPMSVYMVGKVQDSKAALWLPVHARYRAAVTGGGTARNTIQPPRLYLRCPDQRLNSCGRPIDPSVSFLCNGSTKDKCSVKEIPYTMMTDTVVWDVPVGDLEHYYAVTLGTSAVVCSGGMYLLRMLHELKMQMRMRKWTL